MRETWTERFFLKLHSTLDKQALFLSSLKDKYQESTLENTKYPLLIIELLRLFCENHYTELQNYLRSQTFSKSQYNLVDALSKLLCSCRVSTFTEDFLNRIFDTLTEFSQGPCRENQIQISTSGFLEYAAGLLRIEHRQTGDEPRQEKTLNIQSHQLSQLSIGLTPGDSNGVGSY